MAPTPRPLDPLSRVFKTLREHSLNHASALSQRVCTRVHAIEPTHYGDDVASMAWAGGVQLWLSRSLDRRSRARAHTAVRSVGRRAQVAKRSAPARRRNGWMNSCADFVAILPAAAAASSTTTERRYGRASNLLRLPTNELCTTALCPGLSQSCLCAFA